jgi:hypothetical protein
MGLTTFGQAKEWVAPGYGDCQPDVTGEVVNAIRQHFYNWYGEIDLFLDVVECFAVKRYCMDCNECRDSYLGVTLPREAQNVEAIWLNDWPVRMASSWREYQQGLTPECDCRLETMDVPGTFCTFEDIALAYPVELLVVALDPADAGKRFKLRGIDGALRPFEHEVQLSTEAQTLPIALRSIEPRGGVVKEQTKGRVLLLDRNGKIYGQYAGDETVPAYRRQKISGIGMECGVVNIRSARQYFPLYGDDDVVESDNRMAFDAMARYLREYRRVEKTQGALLGEKNHLETARKMIIGSRKREVGRATTADVKIATPSFAGKRLSRFGGRW